MSDDSILGDEELYSLEDEDALRTSEDVMLSYRYKDPDGAIKSYMIRNDEAVMIGPTRYMYIGEDTDWVLLASTSSAICHRSKAP